MTIGIGRLRRLAWVIAALAASVIWLTELSEAQAQATSGADVTSSFQPGTNLAGRDIRGFDADSARNCMTACLRDSACEAWTWVKPGLQGPRGRCWIKHSVPDESRSGCCISGVKTVKGGPAGEDEATPSATGSASVREETFEAAGSGDAPQATAGGVEVWLAKGATVDGRPIGPTLSFEEGVRVIHLAARNTTGRDTTVRFEVSVVDVEGLRPGSRFWSGGRLTVRAGRHRAMKLEARAPGMPPGRYRVEFRVGGSLARRTITIEPENPFATPIAEGEDTGLGPNIALAALGGRVEASSEWDADAWAARWLNDGIPYTRSEADLDKCGNCGWSSAQGDRRPSVTARFHEDREAEIAAVVIDTRRFREPGRRWDDLTQYLPKTVAVEVSRSADGGAFERVATARLRREFFRQRIDMPEGTRARRVRIIVLENFSSSPVAVIVELEVREVPDAVPSVVEGVGIDLARPALGGAAVRYTGYHDRWSATKMFDGHPHSWVSHSDYFPQDITLAFNGDHLAEVDRVEIELEDKAELRALWPAEIAVSVSPDNPLDGFREVARVAIPQRAGRHTIGIDAPARFLKLRVLDNHGGPHTAIAELRVIEAADAAVSVLDDGTMREADDRDAMTERPEAEREEAEPNDTPAEANALAEGERTGGRIDPLGERDVFALPPLGDATALTLDYDGRPHIRHALSLLDAEGSTIKSFDPGDLPARDATLSFRLRGDERYLALTEPPASVVVIWDTSGSMKGAERDLERAVRGYVRAAPESQRLRLLRFSNDVVDVTPAFVTDKGYLAGRLDGNFFPDGGTRLYDAILKGLDHLEGRAGNRAIVLMTDGLDTSRTWLDDVYDRLERERVRLYAIGLGDGLTGYAERLASSGERMLGHLAAATDGRSFFAADSASLRRFYAAIAEEMAAPATYLLRPRLERGAGLLEVVATGDEIPSAAMPPVHVIFDVSGSMSTRLSDGRRRIDAARAAMEATLDGLPEGAPFGLTVYGARIPERPNKARACTDISTVQETGPLRKAQVRRFVRDLRPRGGTTPLASSIAHVFDQFGREGGIIIAITDGIEECDAEPVVTVERLAAANVDLELNLIGFDLRQEATREMMRRLAEAGRGRYYDAGDGAAVAEALRDAMAAPFFVRDAAGSEVARGVIGGEVVEVPSGTYEIVIQAADGAIRTRNVRVEADLTTTVSVNKVAREVAIEVGEPREFNPLVACGEPAVRRGEAERLRRIQSRLNELGFPAGPADNLWGRRTAAAITAFLDVHGLDLSPEPDLILEQHLDCVASVGAPLNTAETDKTE